MKKLFIIIALLAAAGIGYMFATNSGHGSVKANASETSESSNNNYNTGNSTFSNQNTTTANSQANINTNKENNNSTNSSEKKYGNQFDYKLPFQLVFNTIQNDISQYRPYIENTFKNLYSKYNSVQVIVDRIYVSDSGNTPQLSVIYNVNYLTDNHNIIGTGLRAISIPWPQGAVTKYSATLPQTWKYTNSPITIAGSTIPKGVSYITLPDGSNIYYSKTMHFKNYNSNMEFYTSQENANLNKNATTVSAKDLIITGINKNYVEVLNEKSKINGFVKLVDNPVLCPTYGGLRTPLEDFKETGLYNSTAYQPYDLLYKFNKNYNTIPIMKYPTILSPIETTYSSSSNIKVVALLSGPNWSLVEINGQLGWISSIYYENQGTADESSPPNYTAGFNNTYTKPIGYSLNLKGYSGEGSNSGLLEQAMNIEFDGTGDKVTATDTGGIIGMGHSRVDYTLTYTTPDGKTITKKNLEIGGGTDPDTDGEINFYTTSNNH